MRTCRIGSAVALIALVVVGLSGCMKVDADLTLQSDDTIDGTMLMAYTNELAESMGLTPDTVIGSMGVDATETGPGETVTVEPYNDDDYMGGTVTFTGYSLDRFADDSSGAGGLTIERDGDEFVVSGTVDLTDENAGDFAGMTDGFDAQISITFPGAVGEHTGDLSGNTVTWTPKIGESLEIQARGSAVAGGLSMPLMIGVGVGVLLLIGLILFFVLRSRKGGNQGGFPAQGYAAPQQGYGPPAQQAPPQGYAPPAQQAPPQGYGPPQGQPPQAPPPQGYAPPQGQPPQAPPPQGYAPPQGQPPQAPPSN